MKIIKKNFLIIIVCKFFFCFNYSNLYSNDQHESLLKLLEINYPAEIFFKQSSSESYSEGWMLIEGKGKARIEFSPPNNIVIVADGKWIIFHDPELDRTTYLPLKSGVLQALLDPRSFNSRKDFIVTRSTEKEKIIYIIEFNINEQKQEVMIYFNKKNLTLLGWKIIESVNEEINVEVISYKKFTKADTSGKDLFKFTEEMRDTGIMYYGPYKRKINKIKNNGKLE